MIDRWICLCVRVGVADAGVASINWTGKHVIDKTLKKEITNYVCSKLAR